MLELHGPELVVPIGHRPLRRLNLAPFLLQGTGVHQPKVAAERLSCRCRYAVCRGEAALDEELVVNQELQHQDHAVLIEVE
eukprot:scaffold759_cov119-Isochrysis_galbana.AAC.15